MSRHMQRINFVSRRLTASGIAIILLAALPGLPAGVWAFDSYLTRGTLKGIRAVEEVVDGPGPDAEGDGLRTSQLHTDVAARLTQAGITVVPRSPEYLNVVVNAKKESGGLYGYSVRIDLNQPFTLIRDPRLSLISGTWGVDGTGVVAADRLSEVRCRYAADWNRLIEEGDTAAPRPRITSFPSASTVEAAPTASPPPQIDGGHLARERDALLAGQQGLLRTLRHVQRGAGTLQTISGQGWGNVQAASERFDFPRSVGSL